MHEIGRIEQSFEVRFHYPVVFTRAVFDPANPSLLRVLQSGGARRHRVLVAVDSGVLDAWPDLPERLRAFAARNPDALELVDAPLRVRGGEVCKTDPREVEEIHERVERHRLCRQSFVLAIGGGAVLDAVGYAVATAHRGLRLLRLPTTVLAQNDAGIGVKNAINRSGRKNFLGTFAPPFAVLNDLDFLSTLPQREMRAGLAEALKVALIRDAALFAQMHRERRRLAAGDPEALEAAILRCAELHLAHIRGGGDPFEMGTARPLDFGHWSAHKLEELSSGELRHGEAVAIGLALDSLYSRQLDRIGERDVSAILTTLEDLGFLLRHPLLAQLDVEEALAHFREHLGGELSITLLDGIGRTVETDHVDVAVMHKCIELLLSERTRAI